MNTKKKPESFVYHHFKQSDVVVMYNRTTKRYLTEQEMPEGLSAAETANYTAYCTGVMGLLVGHIRSGMNVKTRAYEAGLGYALRKLQALAKGVPTNVKCPIPEPKIQRKKSCRSNANKQNR